MRALLAVEVRRVLARRLVRLFVALGVLGVVAGGIATFASTDRVDPGQIRRDFEARRASVLEGCREFLEMRPSEQLPPGAKEEEGEPFCVELAEQQAIDEDPTFRLSELHETMRGTTVPFVIVSWVVAASLIGAEWRAGTVTTELTWEPRRVRLLAAKAIAAILFALAFTIMLQALLAGGLSITALAKGSTEGAASAWGDVAVAIARGAALAGMAAAVGFAVGQVGRNTAVALGAGFVYLALLEGGLIGGLFPGIRRWLIVGNAVVFVAGESPDVPGRSVAAAGVLLGTYALGSFAVSAASFRARDVT